MPSSSDTVTINESGVTVTVSDSEAAGSLTTASGANLAVTAGALTLASASTLNGGFDLSGGKLTMETGLTLAGNSTWSGGSIGGPGSLTNTGTLAVTNSSTTSPLVDQVNLNNAGTITQAGSGDLGIASGLTLNNEAFGVYDLQSDASVTAIAGAGQAPQILNFGLFQKSAGSGTSTISGVTFEHSDGRVEVESGTLAIPNSGAAGTGAEGEFFSVAQGSVLDLSSPDLSNTLEGTFTGSGAGTVLLGSGFLSTGAAGATFAFPGSLFHWTGGTIVNNGGLINQGTINLSGSGNEAFGPGLLDNAGTIIEIGGQISLDPDTTLLNEAGGVYNLEVDATLGVSASGGGANPVLVNAGSFKKSGGKSKTTMAWDLDNTGTFEVDAGTLTQSGNVVEAASGALTAGTWVVSGGASLTLSQPGNFTANQANVTLTGAVNVHEFSRSIRTPARSRSRREQT